MLHIRTAEHLFRYHDVSFPMSRSIFLEQKSSLQTNYMKKRGRAVPSAVAEAPPSSRACHYPKAAVAAEIDKWADSR